MNVCNTMEMGGSFLNLEKISNHLQKELNVLKNWDKIKRKTECKILSNAGMYSKESDINWMLGKRPHQEVQSEQSEVSQAVAEKCSRRKCTTELAHSHLSLTKAWEPITGTYNLQVALWELKLPGAETWRMRLLPCLQGEQAAHDFSIPKLSQLVNSILIATQLHSK